MVSLGAFATLAVSSPAIAQSPPAQSAPEQSAPEQSAFVVPRSSPAAQSDTVFPVFLPGSSGPTYPRKLRRDDFEGHVLLEFVVDSTGHAIGSTLKILSSSHELFTTSVREFLTVRRYDPGALHGRKINVSVRQQFTFKLHQ